MVIVNGQERDAAGKTVSQLLVAEGFDSGRIAVERNGDIVPKGLYGQTVLRDGDTL